MAAVYLLLFGCGSFFFGGGLVRTVVCWLYGVEVVIVEWRRWWGWKWGVRGKEFESGWCRGMYLYLQG